MAPNHTYKLLHSKGNRQQNEKTIYRMGENTYKWCDQHAINLQNIQTAHTAQYWKTKQPNPKMGWIPKHISPKKI